ncbi:multidrug resistance protein; DLP12 prophage [Bradyrhizobium sp. STM 3843]|uniref:DMT family transporter n=1 Tax=Bradyrhizobium sp. STM 3843 TaxID=551947 RepID=UPI000240503B|nr:multidrug efflux SMR transporter [Bradyrhizobium sp. STM 3843]CCE11161.1 multidrug resistance protein; DLP12 prophage [Bradyrhizobium sp. STM 3843]
MKYTLLAIAILAEVLATTALKQSEGFSRPLWTALTLAGYAIAFYCLSLSLKSIPTGIAYAIWSGVGIILISLFAWVSHGQRLDTPAMIGMGFIVTGVVVMNLFSNATAQ